MAVGKKPATPSGRRSPQLDEARWQSVLDTARDAIISIEPNGNITLFNREAERIFGFGAEEVLGRDVSMLMPSPYREQHGQYIQEYERTGVAKAIGRIRYVEGRRKNAEVFPIELSVSQAQIGHRVLYTAIIRDVTERRRAEHRLAMHYAVTCALAESDSLAAATPRLLQAICEAMEWEVGEMWHVEDEALLRREGLWHDPAIDATEVTAPSRPITFARGRGLPGKAWETGQPVCITDLVSAPDSSRLSTAPELALRGAFAFPLLAGNDVVGVMAFHSRTVREPDAETRSALGALGRQIGDFMQRKRAEAELRGMEKLAQQRERLADIGAITAQIVHDLGNPLAAISMQGQLIVRRARRDGSQPLETVLKPAEQIVARVSALDTLIREFLDFTREQRLNLSEIPLRSFLEAQVDLWEPFATSRRIALSLDVPDAGLSVEGDAEKLGRVLENLVKNALEAIDQPTGRVTIRVAIPAPEKIRISVEDTGPGIPVGLDVFRLFETTKPEGTGLGLPIARQIVQAHGGSIGFERLQPHGTVFHIDFPGRGSVGPK